MSVYVKNEQKIVQINTNYIKKIAIKLLEKLNIEDKELNIVLLDNYSIRKLNEKYLKKSQDTDVLAFNIQDGFKMPGQKIDILGDIVVSAEKAKQVSRKLKIDFNRELILYIIHGVLHLLGYDDRVVLDRKKMQKKQSQLLKELLN